MQPSATSLFDTRFEETPLFETYHDHRMAMSFAPLGMVLPQGIRINNPMVVNKSYPNFWKDLEILGFELKNLPSKKVDLS